MRGDLPPLRLRGPREPEGGTARLSQATEEARQDVAGAQLQELPENVCVSPVGADDGGCSDLGGLARRRVRLDEADQWLREWAEAHGMTLAEVHRDAGVLTQYQREDIARREVSLTDATPEE